MMQIYGYVCRGVLLVLLKPCDPAKCQEVTGTQECPYADFRGWDTFHPSIYISIFFPFSAAFLCSLHICQAFIKQLKEGVSFPWSTCQLFPISPAPWKGLQTPLFLGLGLGLGYKPYVRGWGSLWRDSLALQTGPGFSLRIDQPVWATQQHPKEPFGIVLHIKPVSSP